MTVTGFSFRSVHADQHIQRLLGSRSPAVGLWRGGGLKPWHPLMDDRRSQCSPSTKPGRLQNNDQSLRTGSARGGIGSARRGKACT